MKTAPADVQVHTVVPNLDGQGVLRDLISALQEEGYDVFEKTTVHPFF